MKKYFARFFSLILALAVTASLTACGGKNPENPTDSANSSGDSDKVYEIRLWIRLWICSHSCAMRSLTAD